MADPSGPPEYTVQIGGETISVPSELPLLPVRNTVLFPGTTLPLSVGRPRSTAAIRAASGGRGLLALLTQRSAEVESPTPADLYEVGTVARVLQVADTGSGLSVVATGIARFRALEVMEDEELLRVRIELIRDRLDQTAEAEAARRTVQRLAKELISLRDDLPDELHQVVDRLTDPVRLADLVAFGGSLTTDEKVALLGQPDVLARLRVLIRSLTREIRVAQVSRSFAERAAGEIDESKRKSMLRDQLRKIQEELGESDEQALETDELRERIEQAGLPEDVYAVAEREVNRLAGLPAHTPAPSSTKITTTSSGSRSASSSTSPCAVWWPSRAAPSSASSAHPASERPRSASRSPAPWAASSPGSRSVACATRPRFADTAAPTWAHFPVASSRV
jgi:ATP-dependent Lon protease